MVKVSNEQVARNLIARRDRASQQMIEAQKVRLEGKEQMCTYTASVALWQVYCKDVRDFRQLHPSAFVFEEVAEDNVS